MKPSTARPWRFLFLVALALLPAAPAAAQEEFTLPAETCRGFFILPLALEGREDRILWLLYDTGASSTMIDPDSLEAVTTWRRGDAKRVRLSNVKCGAMTFNRLSARAYELDHISRALGRPIDGILAFTALDDVLVTLDYADMEIRVANGELPRPDNKEVFRLNRKERQRPWLDIEIGGREKAILIDSGSTSGFSLRPSRRWEWSVEPTTASASTRINKIEIYKTGRLARDARIAGQVFTTPVLQLTEGTELMGTQVMGKFDWTFDQKNRRVRIVQNQEGPFASSSVLGTGALFAPKEAGLEIIHVIPDSPAEEAGLRKGDLVTAFDGRPVFERDCAATKREGEPPTAFVYTLLRGGGAVDVSVGITAIVP